ncbi:hypothetical protein LWM68_06905 [Niabella sp. W65]|nr:hypothetical protein [Niabella sp. W65]MCH7362522.1 hypothetical protein [Niabella sp. W65]
MGSASTFAKGELSRKTKVKVMCEGYVLEWLDTLVTVTLNPVKTKINIAITDDIAKIQDQVILQKTRFNLLLRQRYSALMMKIKSKA